MYQLFLKEQAGILAQNLREAEPCPVCGSLTHPHPASLAENAISEAAVKAAKEQREQAETARDTRIRNLTGRKARRQSRSCVWSRRSSSFWRLREMRAATERKNFIRLPHCRRQKNLQQKRGL